MKVFSPFLNGDTTTSGSFTLPQHPTSSSISNPNTGSIYHDTTDNIVKVYTGTQWQVLGEQTTPATGPASADIEYLVIAGGGGGGSYGGGGAGGYQSSSLSSIESGSSITVTIGGGGAGSGNTYSDRGTSGVDSSIASAGGSSFTTATSTGGGGGGDNLGDSTGVPFDGGSGGGGSDGSASGTNVGGSGTVGQGNDGGDGTFSDPNYMGGGGGGAGTAGADATTSAAGDGGDGLASSITGTSTTRAGGGGGVRYNTSGTWGDGGTGGGGDGGSWNATTTAMSSNTAGTENTGGGGGAGKSGGKGVTILAYDSGSINGAGGIVGDAGNGRKYHQFNSTGTFVVGSTSDFGIVTSNLLLNFDAGNFGSRGVSTVTDLSGNGNSGTVGNATLSEYYYSFNGSNSYITAPPTSFVSSAYTIETWLYKSSIDTTYDCIYSAGYGVQTYWRNDDIELYISTDGSGYQVNGIQLTGLSASTWYHYTITDNGSGSVKIYLNGGTQTNTATYSGNPITYSGTPRIGDYPVQGGTYPFGGNIAQFRIYTKALSDAEVAQNYEATKTNFV